MNRLRILSLLAVSSMIIFSFVVSSAFADTSYLNSTINDLSSLTKEKKSISVFFPIFFMICIALFTVYGLIKRDDRLASIFTLIATILSIVTSLMFLAPYDYTYTVTESKITAEQTMLTNSTANSTSFVKDSFETIIIPNDPQFRFIISSFFSVFSLFSGALTMLIFTKWSKDYK